MFCNRHVCTDDEQKSDQLKCTAMVNHTLLEASWTRAVIYSNLADLIMCPSMLCTLLIYLV